MHLGAKLASLTDVVFQTTIESLTEGVVVQDASGRIVACNAGAERILGWTGEELQGTTATDPRWSTVRPDGSPCPPEEYPTMVTIRTGEAVDGVVLGVRDSQGALHWVQINSRPIRMEGRLIGVAASLNDISAWRAAEKQRDRLFRLSPDAMAVVDAEGRFRQLNPAWERVLGFPPGDLVGTSWIDLVHPEDRPVASLAAELLFEVRCRTHAGAWRWLAWQPVREPDEPLYHVSARDITDRKTTEMSLVSVIRQNQALLESAADGIYGVDAEGRCTFVNPAAVHMTGFTAEEWLGESVHILVHHSRPDGSPFPVSECPLLSRTLQGTGPIAETFWRKDGKCFRIELNASPIVVGGQTTGAVIIFRDVGKREELDRLKDEFVSIVSHELRTPLTSMRGSLGMLSSGLMGPLNDKAARMLQIAISNTDRLIRLIGDMLDLERISAGQVGLRCDDVRVEDLLRAAVDAVAAGADKAHVRIEMAAADRAAWLDSDRMVQALTNLLDNAIKFSSSGSVVRLRASDVDHELRISVQDEGPGIPPDMLRRVFDRFQQVDGSDTRAKGGTGLGLAICEAIVSQHRGRIWAESAVGKGSTFCISLPWTQRGG
ncbi:MAG TPA: PAS domain S-box protein [Candidatus Xenobia bacterium]|jgi:PAS domain S-box-containing protein